jgi:putative chitinase
MIDWASSQAALTRAGYPCGKADGKPGPLTFTALFAFAAGRQPDEVIRALGAAAAKWLADDSICNFPRRVAEFVAQCANETGGFVRFEEDLRYSAPTLLKQWSRYFTPAQAAAAVGKPVEIASRAYGGRMGNAPYPSKDGYIYRGRGMLQLTGRDNYETYGKALGLPLLTEPDLAADPADSLIIARDFWRARQITNGGTIGLAAVEARRVKLLKVLA